MKNVLVRQLQGSVLATLLGLLLAYPSLSWAVGLGRLSLSSALNQPLAATIDITNLRDLSSEEIRVGLAPKIVFEELGVQWSYTLDDIALRVEPSAGGASVVLTTDDPIVEPFLNFVVEVLWPKGRMIREYTVFLDPPVLMAPGFVAPRVSQVESGQADDGQSGRASGSKGSAPSALGEMTQAGDTLWEIALAARPSRSVSVQEMMLAIQRLNPEAFIDANINRLKAGYVLQMPSGEEFSRLNTLEAIAQVAEQNRALTETSASKKKTAAPGLDVALPAEPSTEGQLVILAEDESLAVESLDSDIAAAAAESARVKAEDASVRASEENALLQSRLSAFEAQLADLADAITIKDAEIARLQKQLADMERPTPQVESPFLATTTIGLLAIVVVLVVGLLLVSARLRRLSRNLQSISTGGQSLALEAEADIATERSGKRSRSVVSSKQAPEDSTREPPKIESPTADVSEPSVQDQSKQRDQELESLPDPFGLPESVVSTPTEENSAEVATADPVEIDLGDLESLEDLEELDLDEIEVDMPEVETPMPLEANPQKPPAEDEVLDQDEDPASMLDLARAYIEMEHHQEAKRLLARVIQIGLPHEIADAEQMLASLKE